MKSVDVHELKAGDRVRTMDGAVAEILNETEDGYGYWYGTVSGPAPGTTAS
jgi:hypothetical protein